KGRGIVLGLMHIKETQIAKRHVRKRELMIINREMALSRNTRGFMVIVYRQTPDWNHYDSQDHCDNSLGPPCHSGQPPWKPYFYSSSQPPNRPLRHNLWAVVVVGTQAVSETSQKSVLAAQYLDAK